MANYPVEVLRESVDMCCDLDFKHHAFLYVGGKSVNNQNGMRATKELLELFDNFCGYVRSKGLMDIYRDRIKNIGEGLTKTLKNAINADEWREQREKLEEILEKNEHPFDA